MADIPQVLATYDALVGVALGAGLTYGFGALNRRHQEKREDKTRWYDTRLRAYAEFAETVFSTGQVLKEGRDTQRLDELVGQFEKVAATLILVASPDVRTASQNVIGTFRKVTARVEDYKEEDLSKAFRAFTEAARIDLGQS